MAKLTVDTSHEYESRAGTITVADALAWVSKYATAEDEESGEVSTYTPGDLVCYAVRRMQALAKDGARFSKGHKPSRIYTPRVAVEGAAKNADAVKEAAREAFAKALHIVETTHANPAKPSTRKAVKAPPVKPADKVKANSARIAEIEAQLAAKHAPKAPAKVRTAKRDETGLVTVADLLARLAAE